MGVVQPMEPTVDSARTAGACWNVSSVGLSKAGRFEQAQHVRWHEANEQQENAVPSKNRDGTDTRESGTGSRAQRRWRLLRATSCKMKSKKPTHKTLAAALEGWRKTSAYIEWKRPAEKSWLWLVSMGENHSQHPPVNRRPYRPTYHDFGITIKPILLPTPPQKYQERQTGDRQRHAWTLRPRPTGGPANEQP